MNINIDTKSILIAVLIGIIIFLLKCNDPEIITEERVVTKTVTQIDTVRLTHTKYVPKYYETVVTITDTIPRDVDTLAILSDYYTKIYYIDTISVDTLGFIYLNDTITQNRIYSRQVTTDLYIPSTLVREVVYINARELYIGPTVTFDRSGLERIGANLAFRDKRGHLYEAGLGINRDFMPSAAVSLNWKIQKP